LVQILFMKEDQETACKMITDECGQNLPFLKNADEFMLERFRFAALKLSNGNVSKLREAVDLGKKDWRDLLVWAQFENSLTIHCEWANLIMDQKPK